MPLQELPDQPLGIKRAAHLLRRATFGATIDQIRTIADLPPSQAVAQLFIGGLQAPPEPPDPSTGLPWFSSPATGTSSEENDLQRFFKCWLISQMIKPFGEESAALALSAREKITMFLHSHFTTITSKVNSSRALYFQNALFRKYAFDSFLADPMFNLKELTVRLSIDNAMLRVLDGDLNVKGNPNENYARELLELYSIGRGLEGSLNEPPAEQGDYILFTEQDVQAAAKILSGWQFDDTFGTTDLLTELPRGIVRGSTTNASAHDNSTKQFSARFGNAVIAPDPALLNGGLPTEESALDEIRQLINLVYSRPETAHHICWKLYRFFVYAPHSFDESFAIDENVISVMAETFVNNGYRIQPVLENLFRSEHFYQATDPSVDDDNFGGIIKSPLDLVVGTYRLFNVSIPDMEAETEAYYEVTGRILQSIENLGMSFYEPFDVAGYEAYHQFPIYHRSWITPNYLARRYDFARATIMYDAMDPLTVDVLEFVRQNVEDPVASDARALIIALSEYLFPVADHLTFDEATDDDASITAVRLNYFKQRFLQQFDDNYWTIRWNINASDLRDQLQYLFNAMMQSPEYQLA